MFSSLLKMISKKPLPSLPANVHAKIIYELLTEFSWVFEPTKPHADVLNVFFVCRAWRDAAQRTLYGWVPLAMMFLSGRIGEWFGTIERFPHLGLHVRMVFSLTSGVAQRVLTDLPLMPNLKRLRGFDWSPKLARIEPPASLVVRPALSSVQLALHQRDNPRRSSPARLGHLKRLSDWFTLDQLVRAELSGTMYPARFFVDSIVACLPDTLQELVLAQHDDGDMSPVFKHIERFKGLKVLEIYPGDVRTTARFNPLERFPALCRLSFSHPDPAFILETGHPALEALYLGQPPLVPNDTYALGLDFMDAGFAYLEYDGVRPALDRLCALVKADAGGRNPARFPRLREVGLLPGGDPHEQRISFEEAQGRRAEGVREAAWKLREVGLVFLDEEGRKWEDEWFRQGVSRGLNASAKGQWTT